ncbi:MAG: hypothetical protein ACTXOO_05210 [Sodalis sp. (in: enterobacteria)]
MLQIKICFVITDMILLGYDQGRLDIFTARRCAHQFPAPVMERRF